MQSRTLRVQAIEENNGLIRLRVLRDFSVGKKITQNIWVENTPPMDLCRLYDVMDITVQGDYVDKDIMPIHSHEDESKDVYKFSGNRKTRGLYISKKSKTKNNKPIMINADVNGSANILRKAFPEIDLSGCDICISKNPKVFS